MVRGPQEVLSQNVVRFSHIIGYCNHVIRHVEREVKCVSQEISLNRVLDDSAKAKTDRVELVSFYTAS